MSFTQMLQLSNPNVTKTYGMAMPLQSDWTRLSVLEPPVDLALQCIEIRIDDLHFIDVHRDLRADGADDHVIPRVGASIGVGFRGDDAVDCTGDIPVRYRAPILRSQFVEQLNLQLIGANRRLAGTHSEEDTAIAFVLQARSRARVRSRRTDDPLPASLRPPPCRAGLD